jgi:hypothetical protein
MDLASATHQDVYPFDHGDDDDGEQPIAAVSRGKLKTWLEQRYVVSVRPTELISRPMHASPRHSLVISYEAQMSLTGTGRGQWRQTKRDPIHI